MFKPSSEESPYARYEQGVHVNKGNAGLSKGWLELRVTTDTGADGVSRDDIFTALSNRRRRQVLHFLETSDDRRVDLRTLVDAVSEWEYDEPAEELPWKKRKRVYTALRQSHLPKLAETGAIEYDRSRGEIELTEATREFQVYLEYVPEGDIPWSLCYLGLAGVGATLTVLAWLSVFPFGQLSGFVLSAILVTTFATSATVHTYHSRRNRLGSGRPPR